MPKENRAKLEAQMEEAKAAIQTIAASLESGAGGAGEVAGSEASEAGDEDGQQGGKQKHIAPVAYGRFKQKVDEVNLLKTKVSELNKRLADIAAAEEAAKEKANRESGNLDAIIEARNAEIERLKDELAQQKLITVRTQVGVKLGLPPTIASLIPGSTETEIEEYGRDLLKTFREATGGGTVVTKRGQINPGQTYPSKSSKINYDVV